jgi:parallel beta-helix repeat protein
MGRLNRARALLAAVGLMAGMVVMGATPVAAALPVGPWSSLNPGTSESLLSSSCPGSSTCYAVGYGGAIVVTRDGGATWAGLNGGTSNRLDSISCPSVLTCFIAGPFPPTLLATTDGGVHWTDESASASQPLAAISCADVSTCVAVGASGTVVRTSDGGATWSTSSAPTQAFLLGVSCPTTSTCYAASPSPFTSIVKSVDGAASWSEVLHSTYEFLDIYCPSELACIAVGDGGLIVTTHDGGATWSSRPSNTTNQLAGVSCFGAQCYAVGQSGVVLASDDGGATWHPQVRSSDNYLETASCLSASVCFVPGLNGTMLASPAGPRTVTNANDSGSGSLRAAIDYSNAHPGLDTITFGIGTGPHSIGLHSGLPGINDPAVIDASTQPGYAGAPLIELDGTSTGGANGMTLLAGSSTVRGFVINRFSGFGVRIDSGSGNIVAGNYIGTNMAGTSPGPNFSNGIVVFGPSTDNLIGGATAADRNLISGNEDKAIVIVGGGGATIAGNLIGTDVTGTQALPNRFWGVALDPGNNSTISGNVISANGLSGILLANGSHGNVIDHNRIGTNAAGTGALGNLAEGVVIVDSPNNTIGRGNVISANGSAGIAVYGGQSTGNRIVGNLIGTDIPGTHGLGNRDQGVAVASDQNTVGGADSADRNVVSGNGGRGVDIAGAGNTVAGNYIGLDVSGTHAIANGQSGVFVSGYSNVVGPSNIVSGNAADGITITSYNNVVDRNTVGLDASGIGVVPNQGNGISLSEAGANTVSGSVISGNGQSGLNLVNAHGTTIQGNYIGTDRSGQNARPNQGFGAWMQDSNHVTFRSNVISGNQLDGIYALGSASDHTTIQSNLIGTDRSGHVRLGNGGSGVTFESVADSLIGGTTADARNVISGNGADGVFMFGFQPASGNAVQGNYIGTDVTGTVGLGNGYDGVQIINGLGNVIGGLDPGAGNLVSGNSENGVDILYGSTGNVVQGNYIGTDRTGTLAIGNNLGVDIDTSSGTLVGGTTAGARNVISGNNAGVLLFGDTATDNRILGNFIGTDVSGVHPLPNPGNGVMVDANASRNLLSGNVIAFNAFNGIAAFNGVANTIRANSIYANGAMGIDLNNDGVTLNDRGDKDGGANNSQNFPVLSRVVGTPANLVVEGSIDTPNPQTVTIEIYASASPDPGADFTGYGEGQTLIAVIKPNAAGRFAVVLPPVAKGTVISATATDAQGNTSEFALDRSA